MEGNDSISLKHVVCFARFPGATFTLGKTLLSLLGSFSKTTPGRRGGSSHFDTRGGQRNGGYAGLFPPASSGPPPRQAPASKASAEGPRNPGSVAGGLVMPAMRPLSGHRASLEAVPGAGADGAHAQGGGAGFGGAGGGSARPLVPLGNHLAPSSSKPHAQFELLQTSLASQKQGGWGGGGSGGGGSVLSEPNSAKSTGSRASSFNPQRRSSEGPAAAATSGASSSAAHHSGGAPRDSSRDLVARAGEPVSPADGIFFAQVGAGAPSAPALPAHLALTLRPDRSLIH